MSVRQATPPDRDPARPLRGAAQMSGLTPRCHVCGKAIGVYEPLIALCEGEALETSRAATQYGQPNGALYHRACYRPRRTRSDEPVEQRNEQIGQQDGA